MKKLGPLVFAAFLLFGQANAQSVQQSGVVTGGHLPYWITNGVIGDGLTSADSPITSIGATGSICSNSARISSGAWINLCLGYTAGVPTISVQNNGTAAAQPLQFVINGTTYAFPGSLANITIGVTSVIGGTTGQCLYVAAGVVGQQACTLSAITSLTGDVTATGPGISTSTLATVNSNVGTFGSGTQVPVITVNAKGLITAVTTSATALAVGSSVITSGSTNAILYDNGGILGNITTLANAVMSTSGGGVPSMSTTLPSGLTIPSPTFTGTETFPDSATWTSSGISKVAALSVGSATLPSSGNLSISGQYQINGTQIAATNLSDGKTGTGNLVGAASPTISGTWAGGVTFSGNITHSGQLIATAVTAPASAGGNTVIMGTLAAPSLTNTGQAFFYNTVAGGATAQGDGSTGDFQVLNKGGTQVFYVPTGTTKLNFPSLSSGTCASGLGLDSGNNTVLVSCPGAAASVQVGLTTITSGTNGSCLYDQTGTLANQPCLTAPQGRLTLTANTPVMTATASAQTTLRYDCYVGNQVPYYDGTQDNIDTIASCEVTTALSSSGSGILNSAGVFDVWWVHGGANRICIATNASGGGWASDTGGSNTARGTGYTQLDRSTRGYVTNKNSITHCYNNNTDYGAISANQGTYLGTIYTTATGQTSWTLAANGAPPTAGVFGVWNMYNRVSFSTGLGDTTGTWTYNSATIRAMNGDTSTARVSFVTGLAEDSIDAKFLMGLAGAASGYAIVGIGLDVTNAYSGFGGLGPSGSGSAGSVTATYSGQLVGFHFLSANESSLNTTAQTFFGSGIQSGTQTGMTVSGRF